MPACLAQPTSTAPDPELRKLLISAVASSDSFEHPFDAEVWLMDMSERLKPYMDDARDRLYFLKLVHAEARRAELDPELVMAVIHVESRFDRFAISVAGAQGYMQVMPFWLDEIGQTNSNLFNASTNLRMGCTILRYYIDMENGNLFRALGRYNGSLGKAKYPDLVFKALRQRWG